MKMGLRRRFPLLAALVCALALVALLPSALASAGPVTGTLDRDGATYAYSIQDGEVTITGIAKAQDNANSTYEALVPDSVTKDGKTYLVTSISANAMGTKSTSSSYTTNDQLTRLVVPAKLLSIESEAFIGCTALTEVEFATDEEGAAHLEEVGARAFKGCSAVAEWILPDSLTSVGDYAFDCSSALKVKLPATQTTWEGLSTVLGRMPECTELVIPEGCVTLPWLIVDKVKDIVLPSSITGTVYISSVSGNVANELNSLEFPDEVKFSTLYLAPGKIADLSIPEGVSTLGLAGGTYRSLDLPSTLETIDYISSTPLTELVIPASVKAISGSSAFANSQSLARVVFESGSQLTEMGQYAFANCTGLKEVVLNEGLKVLGDYMFDGCSSLKSVKIPASVVVANGVFTNCSALERIEFSASSKVKTVWKLATGCPSLKEVRLPDSLTAVSRDAGEALLSDCPSLEDVYVYTPDLGLIQADFSRCGSFTVHGWGVAGAVLDFAESAGYAFEPFAELDGSAYSGIANVSAAAQNDGTVQAVCTFSTATSYDYRRTLAEGKDYSLSAEVVNGLTYLVLVGNGDTCFGTVKVPALIDLSHATMAALPAQYYAGSPCTPQPVISCNGVTLRAGADYVLSYQNNESLGTATVTATGCGNYTGSIIGEFLIRGASYAGDDRVDNAAAAVADIANASSVVAAWAYDYSGLAAASAFSASTGIPLMAVSKDGLTEEQKAQLNTWGTSHALVVGGANACGASVTDFETAGVSCVATGSSAASSVAVELANEIDSWGSAAVLVNPTDASLVMAAASYAGSVGGPLLFTQEDGTIDADTEQALAGFERIVVVGDVFQVDPMVEGRLHGVERICSSSASGTSLELARYAAEGDAYADPVRMYVVSTADASCFMAWAAVAGRERCPLLLVDGSNDAELVSFAVDYGNSSASYRALERVSGTLQGTIAQLQSILR